MIVNWGYFFWTYSRAIFQQEGEQDWVFLKHEFLEEEIHEGLMSYKGDKTLGLDGLNIWFLQ